MNKQFFLKRNIIVSLIVIFIGIIAIGIYILINYPKVNKADINNYKTTYQNNIRQIKVLEKRIIIKKEQLKKYKKYIFNNQDINTMKKIISVFNSIMNNLKITNCHIMNFVYSKKYINIIRYNLECQSPLEAKKYKLVFKYFFKNKLNFFNLLNIQTYNNYVIIDVLKTVKKIKK